MRQPVVLDFDGSVAPLPDELRVPLADWQEAVRFGCGNNTFRALARHLATQLPASHGPVLTGSGDFHHVSAILLERLAIATPIDVVVLDNHPDNMRFPFGIHCGSWVRRVAALPQVRHVHVVGISSGDLRLVNSWAHYWAPLLAGKLTYWCVDVDVRWASVVRVAHAFRHFADIGLLLEHFTAEMHASEAPCYLSIDKDVLSRATCQTNWDQGQMTVGDALTVVDILQRRLIGSDVTGELSAADYHTWWKRWLSALDHQKAVGVPDVRRAKGQHAAVNRLLLAALGQ